jgi:hypothetical protein
MKLFRVMLLAFAIAAVWPPAGIAGLRIGDAIPMKDVKMTNVDSRAISIGEVVGDRGTLVIFACNHCPFVQAWQERIVALGNSAVRRGIGVIMINSNDPLAYQGDDLRT